MSGIPLTTQRDDLTRVVGLHTQFSADIIGLPIIDPYLTWQIASERFDAVQVAYEISSIGDDNSVITSPVVTSSEQIEIAAPGHILGPQEIRRLRVRVATQYGWSDFSPLATFETGLESGNDFVGRAIGDNSLHSAPSPILRKEFSSKKTVAKARMYATSEGIHTLYLNGVNITDEYFTPGWTAFDDRPTYLTHDVTRLVQDGTNCIAAELGDGWQRGKFGFTNFY
jgi:alpha-L-rhamnosidase